jgi:hypothetical protein
MVSQLIQDGSPRMDSNANSRTYIARPQRVGTADGFSQATMRGHVKRLKSFFGSKEPRQITIADVPTARCQDGGRRLSPEDDSQSLGHHASRVGRSVRPGLCGQNHSAAEASASIQEETPILPFDERVTNHCHISERCSGPLLARGGNWTAFGL